MIAIETRIADLQDALDNPEPDAYDTPDELRRAIRALQRLAAATPVGTCSPPAISTR